MVKVLYQSLWIGESSGPTYTFNELRDAFCGEANFALMQTTYICSALHTLEDIRKNFGPPEQLNWMASNLKDIPTI